MPQQKGLGKVLLVFGLVFGSAVGGLSVFLNFIAGPTKLNWTWLQHGFFNTVISSTIAIFLITALIVSGLKKAMANGMPGMYPGGPM